MERNTRTLTRRELFDASFTGAIERPLIPRLRSDLCPQHSPPHTLQEFREWEGREHRKRRLQDLWKRLPQRAPHRKEGKDIEHPADAVADDRLTHVKAEGLWAMYDEELMGHCGALPSTEARRDIPWRQFKEYAEAKEVGMFFFCNFVVSAASVVLKSCFVKNYGLSFTTNLTWMAMDFWMRKN